jgi:FemAB-related protein (PEP-CTERM system-associated)
VSAAFGAAGNAGTLVVEELAPEGEAAWDAFVRAHPGGSHYHRAGWARVIRRSFGHRALYRVAHGADGIEGVLPIVAFAHPLFGRALVSVPFLNRGGILASTDRARGALLEETRRLVESTGSAYCELRHVVASDATLPARTNKVSMSLPLAGDPDVIWAALDAKVRNLVRKAQRSGLTVRPGDAARDLAGFYDVFAENMRDLGTPVYSARFFQEVFREFSEDLTLLVVERAGELAAAGICVAHRSFTEIHWAASRRKLLPSSPNMLLYWESIAAAARAGRREFCFGRSTEGSGPHRFKKQWGALPTTLHWEYVLAPGAEPPSRNPENPRYRLAIRAWQRLPVAITRVLGPPIVRHLP